MKFRLMRVYGEMHRIIECHNLGRGGRIADEYKDVTVPCKYDLDKEGNKIFDAQGRVKILPLATVPFTTYDSNGNPHEHAIKDKVRMFIDPLLIVEDDAE